MANDPERNPNIDDEEVGRATDEGVEGRADDEDEEVEDVDDSDVDEEDVES